MTNATMSLLVRVFQSLEDTDDYIHSVAEALERYRLTGSLADEKALRMEASKYLETTETYTPF